jgi:hypothetical protein
MQAFSLRAEATYEVFPEKPTATAFFAVTGGKVPHYHETSTGTPKWKNEFNSHVQNANPPISLPITFFQPKSHPV